MANRAAGLSQINAGDADGKCAETDADDDWVWHDSVGPLLARRPAEPTFLRTCAWFVSHTSVGKVCLVALPKAHEG